MSMFSEGATEGTVNQMVAKIKKELELAKDKPEVCSSLKKIGRHALTLFEWDTPKWAEEYQRLFRE